MHERGRQALLTRARSLAGRTFSELAADLGWVVPPDLRRHKGWVGQLIERALGVDGGTQAGPDVPEFELEIKTLPVGHHGRPLESTYVCRIALDRASETRWEQSSVYRKLRCVLWVPIEGERTVPLAERRVGSAFLWLPSPEQLGQLEADWTELCGRIGRSGPEGLTAHVGEWLQVRPKAAHGGVRTHGLDSDAAPMRTLPRGFYLRARFTASLLETAF